MKKIINIILFVVVSTSLFACSSTPLSPDSWINGVTFEGNPASSINSVFQVHDGNNFITPVFYAFCKDGAPKIAIDMREKIEYPPNDKISTVLNEVPYDTRVSIDDKQKIVFGPEALKGILDGVKKNPMVMFKVPKGSTALAPSFNLSLLNEKLSELSCR